MIVHTTWSPTARRSTPGPSSRTTPTPSWPSTIGSGEGRGPRKIERSVPQTPGATLSRATSPVRGRGSSISSTATWPIARQTAAFTGRPPRRRRGSRARARERALAQHELLHLARGIHREPIDDLDPARDLVVRHVLAAPGDQRLGL